MMHVIQEPEFCELAFRDPKGGDMLEWPADLRIRQFPAVGSKTDA